jgi:hypothetical protein
VLLLAGGGLVSVLITWQVVGRERQREYHRMLRRLADSLGLTYTQHSTMNPLDRFAWDISGKLEGREVKLARVPESFMGGEVQFAGAMVISVSCPGAETLSAFFGLRRNRIGGPGEGFPQPHLKGVGAWVAEGSVDLAALGRLDVLGLLATEGVVQGGIEIKEGKVRLYYDLGSPVLDSHPPFVERAARATIELAGCIEERVSARPDTRGVEGA